MAALRILGDTVRMDVGEAPVILCDAAALERRSSFIAGLLASGMTDAARRHVCIPSTGCAETDIVHARLWQLLGQADDLTVSALTVQLGCKLWRKLGYAFGVGGGGDGHKDGEGEGEDSDSTNSTNSTDSTNAPSPKRARTGGTEPSAAAASTTATNATGPASSDSTAYRQTRCCICFAQLPGPRPARACSACTSTVLVPPAAFGTRPSAWWAEYASVACEFAHTYGAPCIALYLVHLLDRRELPPTADVLELAALAGPLALGRFLLSPYDASAHIRVGAGDIMNLVLQHLPPADAWRRVVRFNANVHRIHWLQRYAGLINLAYLPRAASGETAAADDTGGKEGNDKDKDKDKRPRPVASNGVASYTDDLPICTDAGAVLARLCAAFPALGTPAELADLLARHPRLVIAGGAVACAVSTHARLHATPAGDIDMWVLAPQEAQDETPDVSSYAADVEACLRLGGDGICSADAEGTAELSAAAMSSPSGCGASARATHMALVSRLKVAQDAWAQRSAAPSAVSAVARAWLAHVTCSAAAPTTRALLGARPSIWTLYPREGHKPLQLVHSQASTLSHLLWSFDMPHVQVGIRHDDAAKGLVVEATVDFVRAMKSGRIAWWRELKSTPERLARAVSRGFALDPLFSERAAEPTSLSMAVLQQRVFVPRDDEGDVAACARLIVTTGVSHARALHTDADTQEEDRLFAIAMPPGGFVRGYGAPSLATPPAHALMTMAGGATLSAVPLSPRVLARAFLGSVYLPLCRVSWTDVPVAAVSLEDGATHWHGAVLVLADVPWSSAATRLADRAEDCRRILAGSEPPATLSPPLALVVTGTGTGTTGHATSTKRRLRLLLDASTVVIDGVRQTPSRAWPGAADCTGDMLLARLEVEGVVELSTHGRVCREGLRVARLWWYPPCFLDRPAAL